MLLQPLLLFLSLLGITEPETEGLGGLWGSSEWEKESDAPARSGAGCVL